jgi:glycosyltransferase involved in cell wall biosynthesis
VFKAWNIIDAQLHSDSTGHIYWEAKALAGELLNRGAAVRIFSSKSAPFPRFPSICVYPTFSSHFDRVPNNLLESIKNFIVRSRNFQRDLSRIEQSLFLGSLSYFPNISAPAELLAIMRWLMHFKDLRFPRVVVTLQVPPTNKSACIYRTLWAGCPAALKKQLALTVRSTNAANQFHRAVGVQPHVLPSPLGAHERRAQIGANIGAPSYERMVVSFVAGSRRERGAMYIPDVVKLCVPLRVRFFIQAKYEGDSDLFRKLTDLRGLPNVELHEGELERDAYLDAIARSIVLIPYAPDSYQWRTSGVYGEAKFLGAPVIVAAGSWIAEEVKSFGNGLVFEEHTATAIAACIARAQSEIGNLRDRAAVCAKQFSSENGPDRCVDAIESLYANDCSGSI